MSVLGWVVFGGIVGWIASAFVGIRGGCLINIVVGIIGAVLGGFLFSLIGGAPVTGFDLWSLFVAVIGAIVFIAIVRMVSRL